MKTDQKPTPRTDKVAHESHSMPSLFFTEILETSRTLERELAEAQAELETERIRLAACGVVAMADTVESREKARDMLPEYRSASIGDVERRVDECINLREQRDEFATRLRETSAQMVEAREERDAHHKNLIATRQQRDRLAEALDTLTLVVGLTPIAGNKEALQEAMDNARKELAAVKGGGA